MRLSQLKENQTATITAVNDSCPLFKRLYDMGFTPGQRVKCVNIGMFRSPIAYIVRGTKIALRKKDAAMIGVVL